MSRTTLLLFAAICFIGVAQGFPYNDLNGISSSEQFSTHTDPSLEPGAIIAIVVIAVIIKVAIICCICCCFCACCPCYHWCHPNSTTHVTIVQPPGYPATPGQNNFNFPAAQPQQVMLQDLPPRYDPTAHKKLAEPANCELGFTQHQ